MKKFDVGLAMQGAKICTRDGKKARIICFDRVGHYPIVALIDEGEKEMVETYTIAGFNGCDTECDLMLVDDDEKIRKALITYITYNVSGILGWSKNELIAWLEKQGESSKSDTEYQPHEGDSDNPYDMSFEEAQQYTSERGIDIPLNDGDIFVDERYITQTIGNILRWADEHLKGEQPKTGKKEEPIKKVHACDKCAKEHPGHSCADISELGRCRLDHETVEWNVNDPDMTDWIGNK